MGVKAALFDFGGVLVLSDAYPKREQWEARLGMEPGALASFVFNSDPMLQATLGKISVDAMWRALGEALGLKAGEYRQLYGDFFGGEYLNQELLDFARSLRADYRVAILSNAWTNARQVFTEGYALDAIFDPLIISAEVGLAKPDPAIYHLAVERLDSRPEEVVFLDDSLTNVEAARAVGLRAVHYQGNAQAIAEMKAHLAAG